MEQLVFLNGSLIPKRQATISPFDFGFLYGYALFETMRAYSGIIFRLQRHIDRITHSANALDIPLGDFDLEEACYNTLRANNLDNARVRLTISRGESDGTPDLSSQPNPTIFIMATTLNHIEDGLYPSGINAIVSSIRRNSRSPISIMKTANYLDSLLARQQARKAGAQEAILLNEKGNISEGSTSNIFLVSKNNLITPDIGSGCLPGIVREVVIEISSEMGMRVTERELALNELLQADEAFLTNSVLEIMPLYEVNSNRIGDKKDLSGHITAKILKGYKSLVKKETSS